MTTAEARIFLSLEHDGDPFDAYEDQLFQFKQFFTSKAIIRSTFQARLKKLKNIDLAARVMGVELPRSGSLELKTFMPSENILDSFQEYQKVKSSLFQAINLAQSVDELEAVVENLLTVHAQFAGLWPEIQDRSSTVILSKEMDPMMLLVEIKTLKANGIGTFSELAKNLTNVSESILNESMRLFLVNQKEIEWKKSLVD